MMTLAAWREARGLTLDQLAVMLGVQGAGRVRTVQRYLSGERFPPAHMLRRIRSVTEGQVTADDFVDQHAPPRPEPRAAPAPRENAAAPGEKTAA